MISQLAKSYVMWRYSGVYGKCKVSVPYSLQLSKSTVRYRYSDGYCTFDVHVVMLFNLTFFTLT